jgi:glycosyltransferase involved in cell wall biosynthesis
MNEINNIARKTTVTAIVCAYNEQNTIYQVVKTLSDNKLVDKIIVVNDGSTDDTIMVLNHFESNLNIQIINLAVNQGKGNAVTIGVQEASDGIILFIDADITNLDNAHISMLVGPLLNSQVKMTVGYPPFYRQRYKVAWNYLKWLSGERAVWKRDVIRLLPQIKNSGYGIETIINHHYRKKHVQIFALTGLHHVLKDEKYSLAKTSYEYVMEAGDILKTSLAIRYLELKNNVNNKFIN